MTPAFAALRDIAAGRAPAGGALLQNCRLEGFGTRAFGREPILDLFRRSPLDLAETMDAPESPHALVAVEEGAAVFADLYDNRVARLWVLGDVLADPPEPAVSVARDLDLSQAEAGLFFDPGDHPALSAAEGDALAALAGRLANPGDPLGAALPAFSRRVFIVRAFSARGRVAALAVCAGVLGGVVRKPFSVNVVLLGSADGDTLEAPTAILDRAGLARCHDRAWTPRL